MSATVKKTFVLRDAGGDLTKKWFIHFKNPTTNKWEKYYEGINQPDTVQGRVAAADVLLKKLLKAYKPPPPNAATKAMLYAALLEREKSLRKKSYQSYLSKLNTLFDYLDGKEVNAENLTAFFKHVGNTSAPGTAYDTYYTIKRVLNYCKLSHLASDYKPPMPQPEPFRYFQPYQVRQLREHLATFDPALLLWCEFVYYCFLRPRSELRFLRVHHILFEEGKILVPAAISKNKKSDYVIIPDAFAPAIEHLKQKKPNSYVFPGKKDGTPTGYNTMGQRFHEILERLGFDTKTYSVYSWKHTGAVACVKAGIGMKALQLQLRHHSLDQVDEYLRQLKVGDFDTLRRAFPAL